ncbi:mitochondrial carrier [Viridothelium virens]|uniref:Mitochondrial carrier n=1 Tax=Viridothelium virens TaxID=1048519 RepID=A0A6A6H9X4_VIRVR|nr:mitochondrial carrier [Viridothelium virens]
MSGNTNTDIWVAGAFAAFTVDLLVYPLDTLKTRLQSPDYKRLYTNAATNTVNRGVLFRGLYQGVGSVIIATLPSSGAFFTTYEASKSFLATHNPKLSYNDGAPLLPQPLIHAAASSIAELVSCAILTPAEVIKQNAQMVNRKTDKGLRGSATMQTLARFKSSPLSLWRGYTALAGRNLPFTALQFPLFEQLKKMLTARRQRTRQQRHSSRSSVSGGERKREGSLSVIEHGVITATSAGLAGSVSAWVTTPVDVVKTRVMLAAGEEGARKAEQIARDREKEQQRARHINDNGERSKPLADKAKERLKMGKNGLKDALGGAEGEMWKKKGSLEIAREIVRENGVKGLFRGGALRSVWTMLGSGLYLGVYESGRIWLARRRGENVDEDDIL